MDDVTLPPELKEDPLSRLAQREASDRRLDAIKNEIATSEAQLRLINERVQSRESAAKTVLILAGVVVIICGMIAFSVYFWSSRRIADARADRDYASYLRERQENAELGARQHTFGAHFDPVANGWFIDFPPGTAFHVGRLKGLPAIQVLPHGR